MSDYARAADLRAGDVVVLLWGGPEPVEVTGAAPWHGPLRAEDLPGPRWLVTGWQWDARAGYRPVVGVHGTRPSFTLLYRPDSEEPPHGT